MSRSLEDRIRGSPVSKLVCRGCPVAVVAATFPQLEKMFKARDEAQMGPSRYSARRHVSSPSPTNADRRLIDNDAEQPSSDPVSPTRAPSHQQREELREKANAAAENQENGYLPCIPGDVLNSEFKLERELGRGESSCVWLARRVQSIHSIAANPPRPQQPRNHQKPPGRTIVPSLNLSGASDTSQQLGESVALKLYRCESKLLDSMTYERMLLSFLMKRQSSSAASSSRPQVKSQSTTPRRSAVATPRTPRVSTPRAGRQLDKPATASPSPSEPADGPRIDFGVCELKGSFVQQGRHGNHPCLVFEVLGPPVDWLMEQFDFGGIPHRKIIIDVLLSTLRVLVHLAAHHVIHTDLKPENLLLTATKEDLRSMIEALNQNNLAASSNTDINDEVASAVTTEPHQAPCSQQVSTVNDSATTNGRSDFSVKIIDFGLSYVEPPELRSSAGQLSARRSGISQEEKELLRVANYHKGALIQTREYRAPEIILGSNFGPKADVWSLGCMAYELVTGRFLFDPKVHPSAVDEDAMDVRHVMELIAVLGAPPTTFILNCGGHHVRKFFDMRTGRFRFRTEPRRDLYGEVQEYFGSREAAMDFVSFLFCCLTWDPAKRLTPERLLQQRWITGHGGT